MAHGCGNRASHNRHGVGVVVRADGGAGALRRGHGNIHCADGSRRCHAGNLGVAVDHKH